MASPITCKECGDAKPAGAFRAARRTCRDCESAAGLRRYHDDREKCIQKNRLWKAKNQNKVKAYTKARCAINRERTRDWRKKNTEKVKAQERGYRERHREELRAKQAKLRASGSDKLAAYTAASLRRNPKLFAEAQKRWRKKNPYKVAEQIARRRALKKNAPIVEHVDRAAIIARDESTCYICGQKLEGRQVTLDHVIPLAKGGSHKADNLKVACRSCNSRKRDRMP